ncbi:MAG: glycosyl hydrolase 115 family protein [Cyclobacteriaceae bacterium]|nr:glycosyl hydrolase 115 family protein [Cyclobacteriaceae bacterium]
MSASEKGMHVQQDRLKGMRKFLIITIVALSSFGLCAQDRFLLSSHNTSVPLYVSESDHKGVIKAAEGLKKDIALVTNNEPTLVATNHQLGDKAKAMVIIGTIGKSELLNNLINNKKVDADAISNQWEAYLIQTINNPFPGVDRALVIAGSDKRGTIYGIYEISKQIGVSPWHWWADVPAKKQTALFVSAERQVDMPVVKYRGIFINDEQPALGGWVKENYGGFNSKFYTKVFELILRLKGNFLWPAMWGQSFYTEDPLNPKLADEYGIVISTSHHEPMMRAHVEWQRASKGKWNYYTNETALKEFWQEGIARMGNYESVVTLAMRGDGDEPMSEESNIALLQKIVNDQRNIIQQETGKPITATPQVWALYKEVQDYYDKGMRVPDDITLLLCDDNWGNIRKLPLLTEPKRTGGYGIYYHFDYVGGPRNYKWLNTNPIERVWEQMHLAYQYGVDRIWIVNVGDIKPMEFPISFFLDYAWNPTTIHADDLKTYTEQWCAQQFGNEHAIEAASLISGYLKYNGRVKPELLNEKTYSLDNYNEFERVVMEYQELRTRATQLASKLESEKQEAFYQLILHPIQASANLYEMYYYVALNHRATGLYDVAANTYADKARAHYLKDSLITVEYHMRNNGKWNHMMSQTHIGYTNWQQPPVNKMPAVHYITTTKKLPAQKSVTSQSAQNKIPSTIKGNVFFELDKYVAIDADQPTNMVNTTEINWKVLPNHGKTGSAITTFPVTAKSQKLSNTSAHVAYEFYSYSTGAVILHLYFSPTLNFHASPTGLQYAVSIDDEVPQVFSLNANDQDLKTWEKWVANNINIQVSLHNIQKAGKHTLKFWAVDSGIVLQKIVLDFGGLKPSYLGPPQTKFNP